MYGEIEEQRLRNIEDSLEDMFLILSEITGVSVFDIKIRFRVLLPLANIEPFRNMSTQEVGNLLYERLAEEVTNYGFELRKWKNSCGFSFLQGCSPIYCQSNNEIYVYSANGIRIQLEIKDVDAMKGRYLEKEIHYLHSFRKDAVMRKGLFIEGYSFPILYASIIKVCCQNKLELVNTALNETDQINVYEISRSVGCDNIPYNSVSLMYSYIKKLLSTKGAHYIITAINHFLGFNGASIKASGFKYLLDRYVDYSYTQNLSYIGPLDKDKSIGYYTDNNSLKNQIYYIRV